MTNEEYIKAIDLRRSHRAYSSKPLGDDVKNVIKEMVDAVNQKADFEFIFVDDAAKAFKLFSGRFSMIVVCGPDTQKAREDSGYYGESIVLQCVYHGLGTCWVSGTYNENTVYEMLDIPLGKRIYCVITIGYPRKNMTAIERTMYAATHRKNKTYQDMFEYCDAKLPEEFAYGMQLVEKAPSGVNRRPVKFRYENGVLSGCVEDPYSDKSIDFGIAKLHFVLGCRAKGVYGKWSYENVFEVDDNKIIKIPERNE